VRNGSIVESADVDRPCLQLYETVRGPPSQDGTTSFESFHGHNKKALNYLKAIPVLEKAPKSVPEQSEGHVEAMSAMLAKWRKEGLFEPRPMVSGAYGAVIVAMIVGSVALASRYPLVAGLVVGTAWAHCGFLQHMGGHREMGGISFAWQHFFEGFCKGGSASWWRNRHNKHHAKTNVLGEDGDLRTTPFFAWDTTLAKKVPNWSLRTQAFTFLPALGAYVFIFAFTVRKFAVVKKLWLEVGLMVAHYAAFAAGLYFAGCSLGEALTYYCTGYAFQGIYLGFFFGLSHFAAERVPSEATWMESTMCGTVNWAGSSALAGYVSGFLNVQIEHHMAPQMPMENLRRIRGDCKALAEQFGLPYREMSFLGAVELMLGGLWRTGREELAVRKSYTAAAAAVLEQLHMD
jgi:fatty acid desaturase